MSAASGTGTTREASPEGDNRIIFAIVDAKERAIVRASAD
jgi:hypothetical protein